MEKVVVYNYTYVGEFEEPEVTVITVKELLEFLDRSGTEKASLKIAVYEVGECLLDWS